MLIILTGCETIHKKFFARKILASLNDYVVDGYSVDFNKELFEVYNDNGELVYAPNSEITSLFKKEHGIIDPKDSETAGKIIQLQIDIQESIKNNHFSSVFIDILSDYGLSIPDIFSEGRNNGYTQPHTYQDVLNNYQNRTHHYHVITGSFSKTFIEKIKTDIGSDNVTVVNILRHPGACFLLNEKDDQYYIEKAPWSKDLDKLKLIKSLITAIIVKDIPGVINLSFEDILRDGTFTLLGKTVEIPEAHIKFNDYLTQWEKDNVVTLNKVSSQDLDTWNQYILNYEASLPAFEILPPYQFDINLIQYDPYGRIKLKSILDNFNKENNLNITAEQLDSSIPSNIFTSLGYTPLGYNNLVG